MVTQKRLFLLLSLTVIGLGLTACEMMGGAGRDIENAGESVQDAAK